MNYNDQILENKTFNFFKQLMYNIALAICIMLVLTFIAMYGFKIRLYEVLSDSQAPYFVTGDMVIVKPQKEYEVGDIVKFTSGSLPVTHRLIAVKEENGKTYYFCHGDSVQSANPENGAETAPWKEDAKYVQGLIDEGKTVDQIKSLTQNVQVPTVIEGEVISHLNNYGTYFKFIKAHPGLLIALVVGVWCISNSVQNEIETKKTRRLF